MDNADKALIEHVAKHAAQQAAEEVVSRMMTRMGLDASHPLSSQQDMIALRSMRELVDNADFQTDINYLRSLRTTVEAIQKQGLLVAVGLLVTGACAMLWLGAKQMFGGHG